MVFIFSSRVSAAFLSQRQELLFLRSFNAEMRESTRAPLSRRAKLSTCLGPIRRLPAH